MSPSGALVSIGDEGVLNERLPLDLSKIWMDRDLSWLDFNDRVLRRRWPEKFVNVTNGVPPRRWMALSNPDLASLITRRIGDQWIRELERLRDLEQYIDDPEFRADWMRVQRATKVRLAAYIREKTGALVDPASIFDIQVKRTPIVKRSSDCETPPLVSQVGSTSLQAVNRDAQLFKHNGAVLSQQPQSANQDRFWGSVLRFVQRLFSRYNRTR